MPTKWIKAADLESGMELTQGCYGGTRTITYVKVGPAFVYVELEDGDWLNIRNDPYKATAEIAVP